MLKEILYPTLAVGGLGLAFGAILAYASIVFKVQEDERIEKISGILPGANCGGCGYAGCSAMAKAIVNDGAPISSCNLMTEAKLKEISAIMGVSAGKIEKKKAYVVCHGNCNAAGEKYEYYGLDDCNAAVNLGNGPKKCEYGCMGLGSCVKVCKFGAMSIKDGIAVVDSDKCTGCGACANICPKKVIDMLPYEQNIVVACKSNDKGVVVKDNCTAGCIGCMMCVKKCEHDAIKVKNFLAKIDYSKCVECGECAKACPKKIIDFKGEKAALEA